MNCHFARKLRRFMVAAGLLLVQVLSPLPTAAQKYVPPAGSPLANKVHPRLYVTNEDLPALRQRLRNLYAAEFQAFVNAMDAVYAENPASKVRNLLLMDAQNFAFLYLIDPGKMAGVTFGHTRAQYGRRAYEHALAARNLSGSERGDTHSSAKLQSSTGAHHNLAMAVVYDWIFPLLTTDERRTLADALIQLYEERDPEADPRQYQKLSNQVTGYIHHGCAAALALWGDDLGPSYTGKAQEMLDYFNAVFLLRTLETGDRIFEGPGWSEGASYYFLGMTNISFLAGAASSALGRNLFYETDILRRNVFYILYNTLPLKLRDNYYMSRHDTNSLQAVIDHHMSRLMVISAGALRKADPEIAGLAKWMLTTGGVGLEVQDYKYYDPRIDDLFFRFIWGCKDVPARSPQNLNLPLGVKLGLGEMVMKSSFDKETSTHLIFWAPKYWYSPHADKDIASFTIYRHGSLALDAGNGKNETDMPRGDAAGEAVFHNILGLYNPNEENRGFNYFDYDFSPEGAADYWQDPEFGENGRNHVGDLLGYVHTPEYDHADYNYTRIYSSSRCTFARRRFTYLRGPANQEFVVIHDVVKSPQQKRFLLHTAFEPQIDGDVVTVTNTFDRAHGRMFVKSLLPANKEILKVGGEGKWFVDADWKVIDSRGPYVDWGAYWTGSYRFEIRSGANEFLTVMQLGDAQSLANMAAVESISATNLSGALIQGRRLVLYARPENNLASAKYVLTTSGAVSHLICGLTPRAKAKIYKNGALLADTETSAAGSVYFQDDPGGNATYTVSTGALLGVEEQEGGGPSTFALQQNYPNPFAAHSGGALAAAPGTVIPYQLDVPALVRLEILDLNGRVIHTLREEMQTAGAHRLLWDGRIREGTPVPAGVYFYRLQAGQFTATRKLVLLR